MQFISLLIGRGIEQSGSMEQAQDDLVNLVIAFDFPVEVHRSIPGEC